MVRPLAFAVPILTLASSSAFAQPPSLAQPLMQPASPVSTEPEVVVSSYRNQILIASGIGAAAFLGAAAAEGPDGEDTPAFEKLWTVGMVSTFLAPPIVHFAHGEGDRGVGSFVMRWAGASLGGMISMRLTSCDPDVDGLFCDLSAFAPGALVGVSVASLIDAFARTDVRTYRTRPTERVLAPIVSASSSGGQVGVAGSF
jgi:hypothetical protein